MSAKRVNDMDRAEMAAHKAFLIDTHYGTLTTGAGASSYVLALEQTITSLRPGMPFALTAHADNPGPSTLNIGTGAVEWLRHDGEQLQKDDIRKDRYYRVVVDDNGSFRNQHPSQSEQPPATIVFLETPDPYTVTTVAMDVASDEYDYTQIFKNSKVLVTVTGKYTCTAEWNPHHRNNLHKIQLMYIDAEGDEQALSTLLTVGWLFPYDAADFTHDESEHMPELHGSFYFQKILGENEMRNNKTWRVVLYAGREVNDSRKISIDWSNCTFTPTM